MTLQERTLNIIKERRDRILNGNINSVPSPFIRFSNDFVGIEQGIYYLVTSFTKGGKSQFVNNLLFDAILKCKDRNDSTTIKILYFALEETKERIMMRFQSWLLYKLKGIRVSPAQMMSYNNKALEQEIIDILNSNEIVEYLDYFEKCFDFYNEITPDGIKDRCVHYARMNGKETYKPVKIQGPNGFISKNEIFDSYMPNNKFEYVIPVIDTINLVDTDDGCTKKQSIDKLSEYCAKILRNRYNMSPIVIQQQNTENESNGAYASGHNRPDVRGLGDSKYTARDCNIMLGIFSPYKFGLREYMGYKIDILQDHFRALEVVVNRDGELGGIIGLYFDGATCSWEEMPKKENTDELNELYEKVKQLNS